MNECDLGNRPTWNVEQHNHEVQGSTRISGFCDEAHNHRFATITGDAMQRGNNHVHEVRFLTDTCDDHHHEFSGTTGLAIEVGEGRHVHFLESCTSLKDEHKHEFKFATLIENPTCRERRRERQ